MKDMENLILFINSFLSYLLVMAVVVVLGDFRYAEISQSEVKASLSAENFS